jgi:c(7)-type cytochrome triheme protein
VRSLTLLAVGLAAVLVITAACSQVLGSVLDLPPPKPQPAAAAEAARPGVVSEPAPPPIELIRNRDSVRALLPRDHAGNIDWAQALRAGIIRPRATLPGQTASSDPAPFQFGYDFTFKGPDTTFDALFPHSTHTEWVACQQCHPRIFPYRNTTVTMGDVFQGRYCGECHGKVSYPVVTGCERCHQGLAMPANRARADFIGDVQLRRIVTDSGNAKGVNTNPLPRATFPHSVHRIRYRCKACHMQLFEPRAGANAVTMLRIQAGEFCGRCHNGQTAFAAGFGQCERCHVPAAAPPAAARPE